jgi:hypothetical protein
MMTREEIIAKAIGDCGNTTRGHAALEALHRAGFAVQMPASDAVPLVLSLRERGQHADADTVEALAVELDHMRRGWGPTTPTERQLRHADLISVRRFIERAYEQLIELNPNNYTHDDVEEANNGTAAAIKELWEGMGWINSLFQTEFRTIPDRSYSQDQISSITRDVANSIDPEGKA